MYIKPEVTCYTGKELLDLMGPVETAYCDPPTIQPGSVICEQGSGLDEYFIIRTADNDCGYEVTIGDSIAPYIEIAMVDQGNRIFADLYTEGLAGEDITDSNNRRECDDGSITGSVSGPVPPRAQDETGAWYRLLGGDVTYNESSPYSFTMSDITVVKE